MGQAAMVGDADDWRKYWDKYRYQLDMSIVCRRHNETDLPGDLWLRFAMAAARSSALLELWAKGKNNRDLTARGRVQSLAGLLRADGFTLQEFGCLARIWRFAADTFNRETNTAAQPLCRAWEKGGETQAKGGTSRATITPFTLPDHTAIRPREWLYSSTYLAGYLRRDGSAGRLVAKTSLIISELLAMTTGRNLLGVQPRRRLRAWYVNLEDPYDELQRRIAAACKHYAHRPGRTRRRRPVFVDFGATIH